MFGNWREAGFWTAVIAAIWLFAALITNGTAIFEGVRNWAANAPATESGAGIAQGLGCFAPQKLPAVSSGDILVVDFALDDQGRVLPAQYFNAATGAPFGAVTVAEGGAFSSGTFYRLPQGVLFVPEIVNALNDSIPYVGSDLYLALDRLRCLVGEQNGEVRVNKALMSLRRQRFWESEREVPATGLGVAAVHIQIIDKTSTTAWRAERMAAAVAEANLVAPYPDGFSAYVRLKEARE